MRENHVAMQEGFSSDDSDTGNCQGCLLFQYMERDPPNRREPLADKASSLLGFVSTFGNGLLLLTWPFSCRFWFLLVDSLNWRHIEAVIYYPRAGFLLHGKICLHTLDVSWSLILEKVYYSWNLGNSAGILYTVYLPDQPWRTRMLAFLPSILYLHQWEVLNNIFNFVVNLSGCSVLWILMFLFGSYAMWWWSTSRPILKPLIF